MDIIRECSFIGYGKTYLKTLAANFSFLNMYIHVIVIGKMKGLNEMDHSSTVVIGTQLLCISAVTVWTFFWSMEV